MRAAMDDPRRFATPPGGADAALRLYRMAEDSLGATTAQHADGFDRDIAVGLATMLAPGAGDSLAALFDGAPSPAVYRHLWRALARVERDAAPLRRTFAIAVVVVAAAERPESAATVIPGVLEDVDALVSILRGNRALAGNESLALANTLAGADALSYAALGGLIAWRESEGRVQPVPPAPIVVAGTTESVHLRFLIGSALAGPDADLFRERQPGAWGVPFAQALSRALSAPGLSVLALPRAPMPLVEAAWLGYVAQREVGAQVFASNAIRGIRAKTGEPSAVISVHLSDGNPRGGEVRLSLSSPFDPRSAEGFRCALAPLDRVDDVVAMLEALLADCRVHDVRRMPGLHADRDPVTGQPLLFKADAGTLH